MRRLPGHGKRIEAGTGWGSGEHQTRRQVLACSKRPRRDVERIDQNAALGRLVTDTPLDPSG